MKIKLTEDSPVMFKLIPETPVDGIQLGSFAQACDHTAMDVERVHLKDNGTLLINVDAAWPDFNEHGQED